VKKLIALLFGAAIVLGACSEADTVSRNIGQEADKFNVNRRIVFMNGITDKYLLVIEGFCSLGNDRNEWELNLTCLIGPDQYKKHFLGLSDNVTYFVEQLDSINVDPYHYKVMFRPTEIVPDIEVDTP